ncbi:adenylate/guanylate cyclase domain-containing protein [Corallococcus sp. CA053C]|uniref:adenylate/guanylate cyclase domain-containing protein n=1 Tax=Corallococcus sp. CA053C TaxID=2316732 RepID=UPI000EA1C406|nr:adenylate/guanylate cyclase domain-containing protein [Corallococcus sp. CA053C]RKH13236.1 adenylate/guanylate cyclase domain-containing protein [Corallococcus sp. CA053C]
MQRLRIHSAGRRFLQRLGFSLLQAALFGCLLGLLVSQRVSRPVRPDDTPGPTLSPSGFVDMLSRWLDDGERVFYDWRIRQLGERSERSDRVVLVSIDDDTLAEAQQGPRADIAAYPWPRQVMGGMVHRLVEEGASVVMLDFAYPELSPRACVTPARTGRGALSQDDDALRALLDQDPGQSVLAFRWGTEGTRTLPPTGRLWPYRVRLGSYPGPTEARVRAQSVLALQRPAFLIPAGKGLEVWAGVADEGEGRSLGEQLGTLAASIQERRAADDAFRVAPVDLFLSLASVQVAGLDPEKLLEVRQLQHPVTPLLGASSGYGATTLPADPDGVVRGVPHLIAYSPHGGERHVLPSLPLAAAMRLAGTQKLRYADGRLHIGDKYSVPMDASGYSLLRWEAPSATRGARGPLARSIRAWNVLLNLFDTQTERPARFDHDLDGRAVILTNTSSYAPERRVTPIGPGIANGAILGQALANILASDGITRVAPRVDMLATMGLAFIGAFLALSFSWLLRSVSGAVLFVGVVLAAGAGYVAAAGWFFVNERQWVAVAGPLWSMGLAFLFTTIYAFRTEQDVRDFVHSALGRYVSPEVARLVARDVSLMRPERRKMSVYLCDIEGFTRLAEALPPEQLVPLLNTFLTEMTAVVRATAGQVDTYIGDSVLAFWGAPVRTDRHAHLACEAALKLQAVLAQKQPLWEKQFGHRLSVRAGIDTGDLLVGDMGSELKSHYTVMGDAVGMAGRLEAANKQYGTQVLVGESTAQLASDAYVFREVDRVLVRDQPNPVRIHELLGRRGEFSGEKQAGMALYEKALTAYYARDFLTAQELFRRCGVEHGDPVARVYVQRCQGHIQNPPPADWDGVIRWRRRSSDRG